MSPGLISVGAKRALAGKDCSTQMIWLYRLNYTVRLYIVIPAMDRQRLELFRCCGRWCRARSSWTTRKRKPTWTRPTSKTTPRWKSARQQPPSRRGHSPQQKRKCRNRNRAGRCGGRKRVRKIFPTISVLLGKVFIE